MSTDNDAPGQFSPLLDNITKVMMDGSIIYQKWFMPISVPEMFKKMKDMEILEDDVIVTGFPRSGNHWAYDVVHMILNQTTDFAPTGFVEEILDAKLSTPGGMDNFKSPRQLVMHNRPRRFPRQAVEKKTKTVILLRNPKDALVSMYILWTRFNSEQCKFKGTWDEFFDLAMTGQFTYGTWFDSVLECEKYMEENPQLPTYVHVYEDMRQNPVESIRKLCQFLEKPDTLAEEIARVTEFKRMKETATKLERTEARLFLGKDNPTIMRKGVIGDWRNTFTVAQNERFDKLFKEKMCESKLGRLVTKYIDID